MTRLLLVGEAWGADELSLRLPFVGESGKELWRMLGEAMPDLWPEEHARVSGLHQYGLAWSKYRDSWLQEASISFTNVFNLRPGDDSNKLDLLCVSRQEAKDLLPSYDFPALVRGKYLHPKYLPELDRLADEVKAHDPNLIVCCGNTPCWAFLQTTEISKIRGTTTLATHISPGRKILPTYHPAAILYQWAWRPVFIADMMKASRESLFPEIRRPSRQVLINPTLPEVHQWVQGCLANPPPLLACDCETSGGAISCIGFAKSIDNSIVIPFGPHRFKVGSGYQTVLPSNGQSYWTPKEELQVWRFIFDLLESPIPKIFQNGVYDLQYILKMGCRPRACQEDSMLKHHSLYPELPKSLGFLGSIYTDEASWKLMRHHKDDTEKRDE